MLYVSLFVEMLRARPRLTLWLTALAQGALWVLIPVLFYAAPPGDLPEVLAIGHEFRLGSDRGPPLAFWAAELAYRTGGMFGVYLLAQLCVVATYWAVFELGRAVVGPRHAVIGVALMVGIASFTVASPAFGPAILAMPLWAMVLLYYWRAVGLGNRVAWYGLALVAGLLLLTSYIGIALIAILIGFTLATGRGRAALWGIDPWIAGIIVAVMLFPYLVWLDQREAGAGADLLARLRAMSLAEWLRLIAALVLAHAGMAVLIATASTLFAGPRSDVAPPIPRVPIGEFARVFILLFALAPPLIATLFAAFLGVARFTGPAGLFVVLSGLAALVVAGYSIRLHHQRLVGYMWVGLLVVPPLFAAIAVFAVPRVLGVDLQVAQPVAEMGAFFAETFQRRTGKPLAIVGGDPKIATLVALGAPTRPSVILPGGRSPWIGANDIAERGAVLFWPAHDTVGEPPAALKAEFPGLVPEVPRAFQRRAPGLLKVERVGWGVIRPAGAPAAASPMAVPPSAPPPQPPSSSMRGPR